jgi:hypothetical protein
MHKNIGPSVPSSLEPQRTSLVMADHALRPHSAQGVRGYAADSKSLDEMRRPKFSSKYLIQHNTSVHRLQARSPGLAPGHAAG